MDESYQPLPLRETNNFLDQNIESFFPSSKHSGQEASFSQNDDTASCSSRDNPSSVCDIHRETEKYTALALRGDLLTINSPKSDFTDVQWTSKPDHHDDSEFADECQPLNGSCLDAKMRPSTLPLLIQNQERLKGYPSDPDMQCGITASLRAPHCMQRLATKVVFLLLFCLASVLQGMYYTYFVSVLTTIERLFQIKSKTTGVIMSATEIGQICGGLFLSYYGGKGHRPRWIGAGMLLFAFCSLLCALPHYLFGNDLLKDYLALTPSDENPLATANICSPPGVINASDITSDQSQNVTDVSLDQDQCYGSSFISNVVLGILFVALLGVGLGQTAVYNLGIPYIDDNVGARESPSYFGITIGVRIFGPTLGFVLGAFCTRLYIDPLTDPGFDPSDPRWIGAWWLGLIIISQCLAFVSLFMMIFPKSLPSRDFRKSQRDNMSVERSHKISEASTASTATVKSDPPHLFDPGPTQTKPSSTEDHLSQGTIISTRNEINGKHFFLKPKDEQEREEIVLKVEKTTDVLDNGKSKTILRSLSGKVLSCFSRRSFSSPTKNKLKESSRRKDNGSHSEGEDLKDFWVSLWRLLRNKVLLLRTASSVLHLLPISGLYTFLPKYLETQFRLTVHSAAMISGTGGILVMGLGIFFSGLVIRKLNPSPRVVAAWIACTALLYSIGMVILMFLGCSHDDFKGLVQENGSFVFESVCENSCSDFCDPSIYSPICSSEGNTYFSACHAGCSTMGFVNGTKELLFEDCNCLDEGVTASLRLCEANCSNLPLYIAVFCLFVIIHSTSEVGGMLLTLRCVKPQDKAMALGLISVAVGLFGNVPCPIIYGTVVDSACIQWREMCNEQGACQLYDTDTFRYFFHGTTAAVMFLAFISDVFVWRLAGEITFDDERPEGEQQEGQQDVAVEKEDSYSCHSSPVTLQSPLESSALHHIEEVCCSTSAIPCPKATTAGGEAEQTHNNADVNQDQKLNLEFLESNKELRESFI